MDTGPSGPTARLGRAKRAMAVAVMALFAVVLLPAARGSATHTAGSGQGNGTGNGQALFQQDCASCHTIGHGPLAGPDLKGVTSRRSRAWLLRWIQAPDQLLAQHDPIATKLLQDYHNLPMPNLGLTQAQVEALIAYLQGPSTTHPGATPSHVAPPIGNVAAGKALFTGEASLQNGGAACISCHTIAGAGGLGGGVMGPDLTGAYHKYGSAGIASVLANIPFPTMKPIFDGHPLTAKEQADLIAFLKQAQYTAGPPQPAQGAGQAAMLAVTGTVVLLILMDLVWRRRLTGVRRRLVERR